MNKEIRDTHRFPPMLVNLAYSFVSVLLLVAYVYIYQYAPLPNSLNDIFLGWTTPFIALVVAAIATLIYFYYYPGDVPRNVWLYLAMGCWFWFVAEVLWVIIDQPISIADALWVCGFVCFTIAFYYQYSIVFPTKKRRIISIAIGAWALAVILPLAVLLVTGTFTFASYINYYYPVADLFVGAAGIALMFVFQGGALLRPWLGLVVFGASDLFYAWAEQTGLYETSDMLTLAIDSTYVAAYMLLGFGFIGHWILINYGLRGRQRS